MPNTLPRMSQSASSTEPKATEEAFSPVLAVICQDGTQRLSQSAMSSGSAPISAGAISALITSPKCHQGASPNPTTPSSVSTSTIDFEAPPKRPADHQNGASSGTLTCVTRTFVTFIASLFAIELAECPVLRHRHDVRNLPGAADPLQPPFDPRHAFRHFEGRNDLRVLAFDLLCELQRADNHRRIVVAVVEGERGIEAAVRLAACLYRIVLVEHLLRRVDEKIACGRVELEAGMVVEGFDNIARLARVGGSGSEQQDEAGQAAGDSVAHH